MSIPTVTAPTFEHHANGLGLDTPTPRVSWRFESTMSTVGAWLQSAYEIEVFFVSAPIAQVYHVHSDQSLLVPWPAKPLRSRECAQVRVRVWGKTDSSDVAYAREIPSPWSPYSEVEAALLEDTDFQACFIGPAKNIETEGPLRPLRFKKAFDLPPHIHIGDRARLYVTAYGVFEAWINGNRVGDECLAPGWTSYKHRLPYRVHDVTSLLAPCRTNVLAIEVAEGWYAGRLGFDPGHSFMYGNELGVYAQLEVMSSGNGLEPWTLLSDDSWSCTDSAILAAGIYNGEVYDHNEEVDDWATMGTNWPASRAVDVKVLPWKTAKLVAVDAPPIRVTETVLCKQVFRSASGKIILDFGQNLVGKLQIPSVSLGKGEKLLLRHAEVLEEGELGTRPLQDAKARDIIIGSGKTIYNWSPRYTYHGFRYVEVTGWPGKGPSMRDIQALVIHTDMRRRGHFHCSNSSVNRLHDNIVWSMRGNFMSLPTDCPQRDERLGWTGDIQIFAPTACFLYDTTGILLNWLQDVAAEQLEDGKGGVPPLVVPNALVDWPHFAQAIWDDVTVLLPSELYQYSSDKLLLERQFHSMQTWLDNGVDRATDGLWHPDKWQFGDWLDPSAPPEDPGNGRTDSVLVANAYLIHTTEVFSRLCEVLGKANLADRYSKDVYRLKLGFQRRYLTPEGNLMSSSQTSIALAIQFALYQDDTARRTAAETLERLIRKAGFNISTGFVGTPAICHALTAIGRPQLAYRMLLETKCPSWLWPVVHMDATTIWERWDSMLPDKRINPGSMTSFNHYALGAVADWLHASVGGISPIQPGWRVFRVRPVPGGNLTHAKVSFDGPYGQIVCEWTLDGNDFKMDLIVPPNTSALVTLPSDLRTDYTVKEETMHNVSSGRHSFKCVFNAAPWPPKPIIPPYMSMPPDTIAE
ncbi:hypothetical protein AtubIFM55763_004339 [Aspergillus tubingensis]|uniref:alpha-L-rhamnosidase n=2 Tax=Aspergillus subgen. Circumdati TaxID=2720871 RepID=A0A100INR3_ASPNG|nr:related to alfa-L-rhamnosidase [Aspergillus tubingensis]GAQ44559.1 hypothetical protein CGLO_05604 [Aspergillus niger]GFN17221.1 related to alfa-L-rhamnosidase [Aspergillus tubingensis]GLA57946.1 hypothetical protein AtubIFM54640_005746 [Aspergillus tubingensis]GLA73423.1 hypothetical protein AtubIFM55763_004339 [Aspergillus tubingensis]GLA81138.1 hypothetical protein AtubIFM56815_004775 [Aspergillus tubingensis]